MSVYETGIDGGALVDIKWNGKENRDCTYASATAPAVVCISVFLDDELIDRVYVGNGESHSWWTNAGGKLLKRGLQPGQRLHIESTGQCALRIDWDDE